MPAEMDNRGLNLIKGLKEIARPDSPSGLKFYRVPMFRKPQIVLDRPNFLIEQKPVAFVASRIGRKKSDCDFFR
ncbi:hypothetical protein Xseb_23350 [Xanthomonas citri pv. sesbaniae]|uniref:Uncharacterized protein n=1 Tax=Xanthomonas citri pv. sesbaniae TaxID=473425 RepID=A0AAW4RH55_XANCI|nr:hypothetical protein [Xanthomonas citri pv. sesbaniae]